MTSDTPGLGEGGALWNWTAAIWVGLPGIALMVLYLWMAP